jgi:formylglycine-generating enzyme required for sulfatase activity
MHLGKSLVVVAGLFAAAALYGGTVVAQEIGEVFRDCDVCPEMVVIPPGSFMMGSPVTEEGRRDNEGPQRLVTIGYAFAVSKFEVRFADYNACRADGPCKSRLDARGTARPLPASPVSWNDAKIYVEWISQKTGEEYRLLSEAEWEYAARAGTNTAYAPGGENRFNEANPFGLHAMFGMVYEWVEDRYHDTFDGAPTDGAAWTDADADADADADRVTRGGAWNYRPLPIGVARSALRGGVNPGFRNWYLGFRVAKTIATPAF